MPYYQNYSSEDRERMKSYIAKRVDKPVDTLSRDDWNGLSSWKFTSLVWSSLDTGLRLIAVTRVSSMEQRGGRSHH
jgi:hypothetical protein